MAATQLTDQHVADDGTLFGEGEFHEPLFRRVGEDVDRDASPGQWLTMDGRRWEVIEDGRGRRWAEIGGGR